MCFWGFHFSIYEPPVATHFFQRSTNLLNFLWKKIWMFSQAVTVRHDLNNEASDTNNQTFIIAFFVIFRASSFILQIQTWKIWLLIKSDNIEKFPTLPRSLLRQNNKKIKHVLQEIADKRRISTQTVFYTYNGCSFQK